MRRRLATLAPRTVAGVALGAAVIAYYVFAEWIVPLPFYSLKYDPEMAYFMNSLALFKGVPYAYIDHPGTPVLTIGSLLLALTRPWTRSLGVLFIPYHVANPQVFLALGHGMLTLASVACVVVLARRVIPDRGPRGILASSAVAVCFFAAYPTTSFGTLTFWSHNSFAFSFGTLLLAWWVIRLRGETAVTPATAAVAGAMAGLLTAVQMYFLAWGFGVLAAFGLHAWLRGEGWRAAGAKVAAAGLGLGAGFFVGFAPVMFRFREFYPWVGRLITRQGRYGTGPEGATTPPMWIENLRRLWQQAPWIFLVSGFVVGLMFLAMRARKGSIRDDPAWWASSLALLLQLAVLWAAIGKHPGTPYLLGVAAVLPLLLALALEVLVYRGDWRATLGTVAGAAVIVAFVVGWAISALEQARTARQIAVAEDVLARTIRDYADRSGLDPATLNVLWVYGVPSRCLALRYGDLSASRALEAEIDTICRNEWAYEVWGGYLQYPGAYESPPVRRPWDLIIVPGRALPLPSEEVGGVLDTGLPTAGYGTIHILTPPEAP